MNEHTATELAYKNGYSAAVKDLTNRAKDLIKSSENKNDSLVQALTDLLLILKEM